MKPAPSVATRSRFDVASAALLATEGGLVANPSDPGGITNFGISLRFLVAEAMIPPYRSLCDIDRDGRIDGQDIRALTRPAALALYKSCFWDRYGLAQLPPPLDAMMLDQCVNLGPGTAIGLLQSAIGTGRTMKLDAHTEAAIAAAVRRSGMASVVARYKAAARAHYHAIIVANPALARFERGWDARVERLGGV